MSTSLNSNLNVLFEKMENFITTKTVVGEPSHIGDTIIVPLVDVSFGVGAGASVKNTDTIKNSEAGGGALGAKITPSAVLVINESGVQLVNIKGQDSINKLIDMVPGVVSKLNISSLFGKTKKTETKETSETKEDLEKKIIIEEL